MTGAGGADFLVVGASGFLGRQMMRAMGRRAIGTYASAPFPGGLHFDAERHGFTALEPRLPGSLSHVFLLHGIVNPDRCHRDPEATRAVNVTGMIDTLRRIFDRGLVPVYLSTDYVFDGSRGGRTEDEDVCPITEYGRQKAEVETWLRGQDRPWLICRSSKIVSCERGTHSVIGQWADDILAGREMRCATDQVFSPGAVQDMAGALTTLADTAKTGVYHVCGAEALSRYALAGIFIERVRALQPGRRIGLSQCLLSDVSFAETRPLDTSLSSARLVADTGFAFEPMSDYCQGCARTHFG